jgi:hypothetical protein
LLSVVRSILNVQDVYRIETKLEISYQTRFRQWSVSSVNTAKPKYKAIRYFSNEKIRKKLVDKVKYFVWFCGFKQKGI